MTAQLIQSRFFIGIALRQVREGTAGAGPQQPARNDGTGPPDGSGGYGGTEIGRKGAGGPEGSAVSMSIDGESGSRLTRQPSYVLKEGSDRTRPLACT